MKAFVTAPNKGWKYTSEHQNEAIDMLCNCFPELNRVMQTETLELSLTVMKEKDMVLKMAT